MSVATVVQLPKSLNQHGLRRKRDRINQKSKKGRVYSRNGRLWADFYYLGERIREPAGMVDTAVNRVQLRSQLDLIVAEIETGNLEFAKRFPHSSKRHRITRAEGREYRIPPMEVTFGSYQEKWWEDMSPGMSLSKVRDYTSSLRAHLLPYFKDFRFGEFNRVLVRKFIAQLSAQKNRKGKALSGKRMQNVLIPLRLIFQDACLEYGWSELGNPFSGLKFPRGIRFRVTPFDRGEWNLVLEHMLPWYRPYFQFAVQTGLRPSEQVALKWSAVDAEFIHIELSRVRNIEKDDLKTGLSRRSIAIRPAMAETLRVQKEMTQRFSSPYVFINTEGRPILQDKLRETWARVLTKAGLSQRRMYETRHTFASWALSGGETLGWVAKTLGHVDTSMVHRTYSRHIPNLTRQDGSAFERFYQGSLQAKKPAIGTIMGTIDLQRVPGNY